VASGGAETCNQPCQGDAAEPQPWIAGADSITTGAEAWTPYCVRQPPATSPRYLERELAGVDLSAVITLTPPAGAVAASG
jgi:hypothetical protein